MQNCCEIEVFTDLQSHLIHQQNPMLLHSQTAAPKESIRNLHLLIEAEQAALEDNIYSKELLMGDGIVTITERDNEVLWLCSATRHLEAPMDTLSLAVSIFDRVLSSVRVQTRYANCLAVTSLILAAKFWERNGSVCGEPRYVIQSLQLPYSCKEVVRMEALILRHLDWNLTIPTPEQFLFEMLKLLGISEAITSYALIENYCAILGKYRFFSVHRPSVIALSLISVMLEIKSQDWMRVTMGIQKMFKIPQKELLCCRDQMMRTFKFCQNDLKKWSGPVSCGQSTSSGILKNANGFVNKRSKKRLRRRQAKEAAASYTQTLLKNGVQLESGIDVLHILYDIGAQPNLVCQ
ncbi:Cyclin, N-terminal domain and Cyclin-like domain-containing protein [Strongyloides ratti]|uniref:Cyclin, N-terminal domain and Cyclin-like domain-containing protein n=1 Tax=Strongyloides ratti TaxID=34506 RepID=A0A090LC14_STRRB|nr:Cyclin, N-terminal domain and Cyclin-like domain-containing protein [Strongyloides ratti]CEF67297.1 Cyclin, N-terminal domain and Cyclin-like domain-containing protein [Strongyloides ratti]